VASVSPKERRAGGRLGFDVTNQRKRARRKVIETYLLYSGEGKSSNGKKQRKFIGEIANGRGGN